MPRSIADIRKSAGGLENLTDEDILQATYQKYKAYYPSLDEYAAEIGYGGAGRSLTGSRLSAGVDQYQANLLGLGGAVSRAVGAENVGAAFDRRREANEAAAAYAAQRARELGGVEDWRDVSGIGSGLNFVGGLAAQSLPYAGEAVAGALTGGATLAGTAARMGLGQMAARTAGAVAASYPSAVGDILSNQREAGGERLGAALAGGVPYAALNAVGLEGQLARGLRPLVQGEGSALRRLAVGVPASSIGEGASETGQELINQYAGRMAVDPNETLFNPEANKRYIDSFVGGAALGGLVGGAGSLRSPYQATGQETDILAPTQPAAPQTPQYGLVTQPAPLQERINMQLGIGQPPVAGKKYASQFEAAYNEPSGQYAQDAATGLERELTMGELMQRGNTPLDLTVANPAGAAAVNAVAAKVARDPRSAELRDTFGVIPTPKALQLYTEISESGIPADSDILTGVWAYAAKKPISTDSQLQKARNLLDAAIIEARKGPTNVGQTTTPISQPTTSVGTGGAIVQGGLGTAGPSTTSNIQPSTGTTVTGTATGQTQSTPTTGGQQAAPVIQGLTNGSQAPKAKQAETQGQTTTTRGAAGTTPLIDTSDDALEIARATGNAGEIEAMREDEAGLRADRTSLSEDDVNKIVGTRFAKSKNASRDAKILNAYLTAMRADPEVDKAALQNAIGDKYGIKPVTVRKIGNPTALIEAGAEHGFSAEQVMDLFNFDDNTKAQFTVIGKIESQITALRKAHAKATTPEEKTRIANEMAALSERITKMKEKASEEKSAAFSAGLQEAGVVSAEGESAGFGFDTDREWTRVEGAGQAATALTKYLNAIESAQALADQYDEQGQTEAAQAARDQIERLQAQVTSILQSVEAEKKPTTTAAPDVAEARKRWNDAGRDLTKLSTEDLKVLKDYTASINNKALSAKIADEISSRGATQETPNAVQVESPTGVSVQPKAKAGQGVGAKVRGAKKPAVQSEAKILTSQEQYEKVTAGFPAPAWADLTPAQQSKMTDLASRDQLNLAAVNRFIDAETAVDTEVNKILRLERGDTVDVTAGSLKFEGSITDEASLRRFPGVESALAHYENNDLRHVVDGVELWMVAPDTVDFDAAILMVDGKQTLAVRSGMLVDSDKADWSIHHELGHIADDAFRTGGIYSSAPELNLTIQKGVVRPMGAVVQEIMDHIAANPNSAFAATMGYPLDRSRASTKNLSADEVRMEVFAQLWAMYNRRYGREYLADNLPLTFDFMELNDEAAKQDQGSADTQAGPANAPQPQQGQANRGGQGVAPAILRIARPTEGLIAKNISKLPKAAQQPVRNSLAAIGDVMGKGLDYLVFTSDLVNRATKEGITSAKKFVDLIGQSKAEARANEIAVEKIADMYALVPEKERGTGDESVNRFLFDSTRESKWGYGQYRDPVMGARFDKLSKESQAFVEAVFAHGSTMLAAKKKLVMDSTNSEYDAMIAAAKAAGDKEMESKLLNEKKATIKRFQTLFKIRDGMPYAPIKRNGSHVVIAKSAQYLAAEAANDTKLIEKLEADSDHYHVSFTDGKWEGRTLQQELIDQGAFESVELAERDSVVDEMYSGHSALRELTKMRSRVDEQAKAGDKSANKMLSLISQMYLEALAEGSARKSEMRRRGVAGEVDMIRSFAQQGRADANFMASVKYNPQVQKALQEMRTQAKSGNRERKSELLNELVKRYIQSMDYNPRPWLNKLTRMSSIYYLATSPAYYLQNLTQPWMMSVPAMAGQHDYSAASGALFKAYTELGGVMKSAKLLKQQFDFDKVPADVRDAIKELVNRGKIDIGLDTEIGEFKVEGDGYFAGKISAADKALRLAVQKVESINRLSTAMAAYRLELARTNGDKKAATDYADRILTETHGDYTSFNAPRAFNTGAGKIALQFRKFQLIQLAFYAKLIKESLHGADRAAALKTLTYSLAHTGVLAGLMGMPGYAAISWVIGALLGDDDEPYDLTAEIRKAIGDEATANLILKGAPTLAGMDISGKVGAGNMLSIMPFSQADLSTTAGRAEAFGTLVGGATLGMTSRMIDGLGLMLGGDWYRGLEQTMPKGVADAMKAYRIANEGLTRRNGDIILPASEISTMDSLFQAIGISPVQQTVTYERQNTVKALTQNFQDRTTEIKNQYTKADRAQDAEAKAQAREAWTKLQDARVRNGLQRKPLSDLLKAPAEQRKREKETAGGVQYTKATKKLAQQYSEI